MYWWAGTAPEAAAAWSTTAPKNVRYVSFFSVGDAWAGKNRTAPCAWAQAQESKEDRFAAIHGVTFKLARIDLTAATDWIKQLNPDDMKYAAKVVAADWARNKLNSPGITKTNAVKPWLDKFPFSDEEKEAVLNGPAFGENGPIMK